MSRDQTTLARAQEAARDLHHHHTAASVLVCDPTPITATFFAERSRFAGVAAISPDLSARLAAALRGAGLLDRRGFLLTDPRAPGKFGQPDWRTVLQSAVPEVADGSLSLEADASAVSELMNVAWAVHETVATDVDQTLAFFFRISAVPRPGYPRPT